MRLTNDGSHAAALAARRYSSLQVLVEASRAKQVRRCKPSKQASNRPEIIIMLL